MNQTFQLCGLHGDIEHANNELDRADHALDFVELQQNELDTMLVEMEAKLGLDADQYEHPIQLMTQSDIDRARLLVAAQLYQPRYGG